MSKQPENNDLLDPMAAWRAARDASLESWSKIMIEFANSETYSQATGQWLDSYLTFSQPFQRAIETTMTQVLTGLNMPIRTDVTNLAERLTNVEIRLDDLDARLDDIQRDIQAIPATIHAADADVNTRLEHLNTRLDDIQRAIKALPSSKPAVNTAVETRLDSLDAKLDDIQRAVKVKALPASKRAADTSAKAKEVK